MSVTVVGSIAFDAVKTPGRTFCWEGEYGWDLNSRETEHEPLVV